MEVDEEDQDQDLQEAEVINYFGETDNSNSVPLNDPQVYRQLMEISRFTRDIRHVSGVDNVFADFLSRIRPEQKGHKSI